MKKFFFLSSCARSRCLENNQYYSGLALTAALLMRSRDFSNWGEEGGGVTHRQWKNTRPASPQLSHRCWMTKSRSTRGFCAQMRDFTHTLKNSVKYFCWHITFLWLSMNENQATLNISIFVIMPHYNYLLIVRHMYEMKCPECNL